MFNSCFSHVELMRIFSGNPGIFVSRITGIDGARSKGISPESGGTGLGYGHRFNCKVSMGYPHIPMDTQQITIPKSGKWISPSISWLRFDVLISNHSASVLMNIPILSVCPHHIHFAVHYPVLIQANDPLPNKKEASKLAINIHSLQVLYWLNRLHLWYIWVNYNDLAATSLESWWIRGIIPKTTLFQASELWYTQIHDYIGLDWKPHKCALSSQSVPWCAMVKLGGWSSIHVHFGFI